MAKDVVNLWSLQLRVDRDGDTTRFQTSDVTKGEFRPVQKVKRDPVSWFQSRRQQIGRDVIGKFV